MFFSRPRKSHERFVSRLKLSGAIVFAAVFAAACASSGGGTSGSGGGSGGGGGGGGGSGSGGGGALPSAASFRTVEYLSSWALDAVGAAEAYALGYTGEGVTIGIVDFGFSFGSSEVDYHPASVGPNAQALAWYEAVFGPDDDALNHGHAVAATAAGVKNNLGIHGIAFDARVLAVDYFAYVNSYDADSGGRTYHVSDPWTYLTSRGVKIINKSYGYDDGDSVSVPGHIVDLYVNESELFAIADGALLVTSAGNNGGVNPILSARETVADLATYDLEDGPGGFVIVGALKRTISGYEISSFSNRAGAYASYFLTAPGEGVTFPLNAPECAPTFLCVGSGTSFAAPLVSGAAALILQRWPTLTGKEIAEILFASATDLGAPGIDAVYGHGMLNVAAALQPIGVTTLGVEGGIAAAAGSAGLTLGAPFGDAPALRAALTAVPIRDSFQRDFGMDFSPLIWDAPRGTLAYYFEERTRWNGAAYRLGAHSGIAVRLFDSPALPFQGGNGLEEPDRYRGVVRFSGISSGPFGPMQWSAGTGLGLSAALAGDDSLSLAPITRAFSPMLEAATGPFATARIALNENTAFSFGIAHAREAGQEHHYLEGLRNGAALNAAAMRVEYTGTHSEFFFELGSALEEGAVLGAFGTGALTLAERSATLWTNIGGEYSFAREWTIDGAAAFALTSPSLRAGSLVSSFGPVLSSSASLGVTRKAIFAQGDALRFTVHQPLRAEDAPLSLFIASTDPLTGAPAVSLRDVALTPSGREIGFELGYVTELGAWRAEFNLAYRRDARHVADEEDGAALLFVSRAF